LNLDHVVPRSQGGESSWENVVCCCHRCNRKKGGKTPRQAGMKLLKQPVKPQWTSFVLTSQVGHGYREWLPFLSPVDASYWNVELEH